MVHLNESQGQKETSSLPKVWLNVDGLWMRDQMKNP